MQDGRNSTKQVDGSDLLTDCAESELPENYNFPVPTIFLRVRNFIHNIASCFVHFGLANSTSMSYYRKFGVSFEWLFTCKYVIPGAVYFWIIYFVSYLPFTIYNSLKQ